MHMWSRLWVEPLWHKSLNSVVRASSEMRRFVGTLYIFNCQNFFSPLFSPLFIAITRITVMILVIMLLVPEISFCCFRYDVYLVFGALDFDFTYPFPLALCFFIVRVQFQSSRHIRFGIFSYQLTSVSETLSENLGIK